MPRRFLRFGLLSLVMMGASLTVAQPAFAVSGGGCNSQAISTCISSSGTSVAADFYQNVGGERGDILPLQRLVGGDPTRCYAQMEVITTNLGTFWSREYTITANGRYGPFYVNTVGSSGIRGSAINRVHIRTCSHSEHYYQDSPRVYYP